MAGLVVAYAPVYVYCVLGEPMIGAFIGLFSVMHPNIDTTFLSELYYMALAT